MLKCVNCNVVINEILAFIQNKCDVMDEDSMIRLCITAFNPEDVSAAKNLLFTSVKTSGRQIKRKREGKTQRDLEDIIALIKQKDPEELPIFVARDLQKLPPVTFDHIDATRLLKDIISLKHEMETIREMYTPLDQFSKLKSEVINLQQTSIVNNFQQDNFVNTKRGSNRIFDSSEYNCDSGPTGFIHFTQKTVNHNNISTVTDRAVEGRTAQAHHSLSLSHSMSGGNIAVAPSPAGMRVEEPTAVSAVETAVQTHGASPTAVTNTSAGVGAANDQLMRSPQSQSALNRRDEDWQIVHRKRRQNRFLGRKGTCTVIESSFKAANTSVPIFINNVHQETCEKDIVSYIKSKTNVEVTLHKIISKQQREYNSYKIYVPKNKLSLFLECNLWPDGIKFRRFIEFSKRQSNRQGKSDISEKIRNLNG